jgi:hypothetical protein
MIESKFKSGRPYSCEHHVYVDSVTANIKDYVIYWYPSDNPNKKYRLESDSSDTRELANEFELKPETKTILSIMDNNEIYHKQKHIIMSISEFIPLPIIDDKPYPDQIIARLLNLKAFS